MAKRACTQIQTRAYQYDKKSCKVDDFSQRSEFITIKPDSIVDKNSQVYSFSFPTSELFCYDLKNVTLCADLSVKHAVNGFIGPYAKIDGKDTDVDPITFCNLPLDSCIDQMEIFINDKSILPSVLHPYRAMVEKSISYSADAKHSNIATSLFIQDGSVRNSFTANPAMIIRAEKTQMSKATTIQTKLCHDLLNLEQYLPGSLKIRIVLHRSKDAFVLLADQKELPPAKAHSVDEYYIQLSNVHLKCKRVHLTEHGQKQLATLVHHNLYFYLQSTRVTSCFIPGNSLNWQSTLNFTKMPSRILVGLVPSNAIYGSTFTNSLFFRNYKLGEIALLNERRYNYRYCCSTSLGC